MAQLSEEALKEKIDFYRRMFGVKDKDFNTQIVALVRQYAEERVDTALEGDIAYAIGRFEGLGYPSEYLKRKYPHLASLDQASNNGTGHAQVCTDQVDYPL